MDRLQITQISKFIKIHAVGADLLMFRDGPSDMTKLIVTVRNFANALKNPCSLSKEDQASKLYMELYSAS